jgi:hypothetical protein
MNISAMFADPGGCAILDVAYLNWGFESRQEHARLSFVSVVCCKVEICASG